MAYGTKFRFRFESVYGTDYEVLLQEDGYSGSITDRPLGKSPVIRMQDSDPIRATSLDLTLECRTDGEYVDLYTLDPKQFKVLVRYKPGSSWIAFWSGFVATEIYSEPDIAPPYDVNITATDGIGVLKEYDYVPYGAARTVRSHLQGLLAKTGLTLDLYSAYRMREYGETTVDFLDEVLIDLDYLAGKSCYDALVELLKSMRCVITQHNNYWLIVREVDVQITSAGALTAIMSNKNGSSSSYSTTIDVGATAGQRGATGTDLWPVGYLTRRVVPAKNSVTVRSEWQPKSGAPDFMSWGSTGTVYDGNVYRTLGNNMGASGTIYSSMDLYAFTRDLKVTLKANAANVGSSMNLRIVKVLASWTSGGTTIHFSPADGWGASSPDGDENAVKNTNFYHDPASADTLEVSVPCPNDANPGYVSINVVGYNVDVYDVEVVIVTNRGYEDKIVINNGARGAASTVEIGFGRETSSDLIPCSFMRGVFFRETGGVATEITSFADTNYAGLDIVSLTALACAKEVAAPRIEITGKLDKGGWPMMPPPLIKSHGVWALVSRFDWDMLNEDVDITAVTLPTASVTVTSETITSIPE